MSLSVYVFCDEVENNAHIVFVHASEHRQMRGQQIKKQKIIETNAKNNKSNGKTAAKSKLKIPFKKITIHYIYGFKDQEEREKKTNRLNVCQ